VLPHCRGRSPQKVTLSGISHSSVPDLFVLEQAEGSNEALPIKTKALDLSQDCLLHICRHNQELTRISNNQEYYRPDHRTVNLAPAAASTFTPGALGGLGSIVDRLEGGGRCK
jgi:hypothetical protein